MENHDNGNLYTNEKKTTNMNFYSIILFITTLLLIACKEKPGDNRIREAHPVMPSVSAPAPKIEQVQNYAQIIYKAVNAKAGDPDNFSDTVCFEFKGKRLVVNKKTEKKSNWEKIRRLFYDTDYVVNEMAGKGANNQRLFELRNHWYVYILEVNQQAKITALREVILKRPADAPPATY